MARPRKLNAHQEAELVLWFLSIRSVKGKARDLGISETAVYDALSRAGVRKGGYTHKKLRAYMRQMNTGVRA